jgi:hypothetical protein
MDLYTAARDVRGIYKRLLQLRLRSFATRSIPATAAATRCDDGRRHISTER